MGYRGIYLAFPDYSENPHNGRPDSGDRHETDPSAQDNVFENKEEVENTNTDFCRS